MDRFRRSVLELVLGSCLAVAVLGCGQGESEGEEQMSESGAESLAGPPEIMATNAFYYYQDLDSAWSFYTRVLGFRTVADYGFAKMVQVGPTSFLTLVDEGRGMHSAQEPKSVTLAVVTQEVEGWWAYLSEAGVEMRSPMGSGEGRPHDGFVAVDPEGYLLEFERFNEHPENVDLLPVLEISTALYPDGRETAPGVSSNRPSELGVQGTVLWLYYRDLDAIQDFYGRLLGTGILVDQGWAKVYPVSGSGTGFLGFVDGDRGLHGVTEEKAVTVSFFTTDVEAWLAHANQVPGFRLREPGLTSEEDFVQTFVGFDPEGYYLEWDEFLGVPVNEDLLSLLRSREAGDSR